jgi:hypothetical protein
LRASATAVGRPRTEDANGEVPAATVAAADTPEPAPCARDLDAEARCLPARLALFGCAETTPVPAGALAAALATLAVAATGSLGASDAAAGVLALDTTVAPTAGVSVAGTLCCGVSSVVVALPVAVREVAV